MGEYIEREAAADVVLGRVDWFDWEITTAIRAIPAADVVPVVRCKDCKHSEQWYADKSRCFLWHESGIDVFNDGFCNYGEKMEES